MYSKINVNEFISCPDLFDGLLNARAAWDTSMGIMLLQLPDAILFKLYQLLIDSNSNVDDMSNNTNNLMNSNSGNIAQLTQLNLTSMLRQNSKQQMLNNKARLFIPGGSIASRSVNNNNANNRNNNNFSSGVSVAGSDSSSNINLIIDGQAIGASGSSLQDLNQRFTNPKDKLAHALILEPLKSYLHPELADAKALLNIQFVEEILSVGMFDNFSAKSVKMSNVQSFMAELTAFNEKILVNAGFSDFAKSNGNLLTEFKNHEEKLMQNLLESVSKRRERYLHSQATNDRNWGGGGGNNNDAFAQNSLGMMSSSSFGSSKSLQANPFKQPGNFNPLVDDFFVSSSELNPLQLRAVSDSLTRESIRSDKNLAFLASNTLCKLTKRILDMPDPSQKSNQLRMLVCAPEVISQKIVWRQIAKAFVTSDLWSTSTDWVAPMPNLSPNLATLSYQLEIYHLIPELVFHRRLVTFDSLTWTLCGETLARKAQKIGLELAASLDLGGLAEWASGLRKLQDVIEDYDAVPDLVPALRFLLMDVTTVINDHNSRMQHLANLHAQAEQNQRINAAFSNGNKNPNGIQAAGGGMMDDSQNPTVGSPGKQTAQDLSDLADKAEEQTPVLGLFNVEEWLQHGNSNVGETKADSMNFILFYEEYMKLKESFKTLENAEKLNQELGIAKDPTKKSAKDEFESILMTNPVLFSIHRLICQNVDDGKSLREENVKSFYEKQIFLATQLCKLFPEDAPEFSELRIKLIKNITKRYPKVGSESGGVFQSLEASLEKRTSYLNREEMEVMSANVPLLRLLVDNPIYFADALLDHSTDITGGNIRRPSGKSKNGTNSGGMEYGTNSANNPNNQNADISSPNSRMKTSGFFGNIHAFSSDNNFMLDSGSKIDKNEFPLEEICVGILNLFRINPSYHVSFDFESLAGENNNNSQNSQNSNNNSTHTRVTIHRSTELDFSLIREGFALAADLMKLLTFGTHEWGGGGVGKSMQTNPKFQSFAQVLILHMMSVLSYNENIFYFMDISNSALEKATNPNGIGIDSNNAASGKDLAALNLLGKLMQKDSIQSKARENSSKNKTDDNSSSNTAPCSTIQVIDLIWVVLQKEIIDDFFPQFFQTNLEEFISVLNFVHQTQPDVQKFLQHLEQRLYHSFSTSGANLNENTTPVDIANGKKGFQKTGLDLIESLTRFPDQFELNVHPDLLVSFQREVFSLRSDFFELFTHLSQLMPIDTRSNLCETLVKLSHKSFVRMAEVINAKNNNNANSQNSNRIGEASLEYYYPGRFSDHAGYLDMTSYLCRAFGYANKLMAVLCKEMNFFSASMDQLILKNHMPYYTVVELLQLLLDRDTQLFFAEENAGDTNPDTNFVKGTQMQKDLVENFLLPAWGNFFCSLENKMRHFMEISTQQNALKQSSANKKVFFERMNSFSGNNNSNNISSSSSSSNAPSGSVETSSSILSSNFRQALADFMNQVSSKYQGTLVNFLQQLLVAIQNDENNNVGNTTPITVRNQEIAKFIAQYSQELGGMVPLDVEKSVLEEVLFGQMKYGADNNVSAAAVIDIDSAKRIAMRQNNTLVLNSAENASFFLKLTSLWEPVLANLWARCVVRNVDNDSSISNWIMPLLRLNPSEFDGINENAGFDNSQNNEDDQIIDDFLDSHGSPAQADRGRKGFAQRTPGNPKLNLPDLNKAERKNQERALHGKIVNFDILAVKKILLQAFQHLQVEDWKHCNVSQQFPNDLSLQYCAIRTCIETKEMIPPLNCDLMEFFFQCLNVERIQKNNAQTVVAYKAAANCLSTHMQIMVFKNFKNHVVLKGNIGSEITNWANDVENKVSVICQNRIANIEQNFGMNNNSTDQNGFSNNDFSSGFSSSAFSRAAVGTPDLGKSFFGGGSSEFASPFNPDFNGGGGDRMESERGPSNNPFGSSNANSSAPNNNTGFFNNNAGFAINSGGASNSQHSQNNNNSNSQRENNLPPSPEITLLDYYCLDPLLAAGVRALRQLLMVQKVQVAPYMKRFNTDKVLQDLYGKKNITRNIADASTYTQDAANVNSVFNQAKLDSGLANVELGASMQNTNRALNNLNADNLQNFQQNSALFNPTLAATSGRISGISDASWTSPQQGANVKNKQFNSDANAAGMSTLVSGAKHMIYDEHQQQMLESLSETLHNRGMGADVKVENVEDEESRSDEHSNHFFILRKVLQVLKTSKFYFVDMLSDFMLSCTMELLQTPELLDLTFECLNQILKNYASMVKKKRQVIAELTSGSTMNMPFMSGGNNADTLMGGGAVVATTNASNSRLTAAPIPQFTDWHSIGGANTDSPRNGIGGSNSAHHAKDNFFAKFFEVLQNRREAVSQLNISRVNSRNERAGSLSGNEKAPQQSPGPGSSFRNSGIGNKGTIGESPRPAPANINVFGANANLVLSAHHGRSNSFGGNSQNEFFSKSNRYQLKSDKKYRLPIITERDLVDSKNEDFKNFLLRDQNAFFFFMLTACRMEHPFCGVAYYNMLDTVRDMLPHCSNGKSIQVMLKFLALMAQTVVEGDNEMWGANNRGNKNDENKSKNPLASPGPGSKSSQNRRKSVGEPILTNSMNSGMVNSTGKRSSSHSSRGSLQRTEHNGGLFGGTRSNRLEVPESFGAMSPFTTHVKEEPILSALKKRPNRNNIEKMMQRKDKYRRAHEVHQLVARILIDFICRNSFFYDLLSTETEDGSAEVAHYDYLLSVLDAFEAIVELGNKMCGNKPPKGKDEKESHSASSSKLMLAVNGSKNVRRVGNRLVHDMKNSDHFLSLFNDSASDSSGEDTDSAAELLPLSSGSLADSSGSDCMNNKPSNKLGPKINSF